MQKSGANPVEGLVNGILIILRCREICLSLALGGVPPAARRRGGRLVSRCGGGGCETGADAEEEEEARKRRKQMLPRWQIGRQGLVEANFDAPSSSLIV